MIIQYIKKAFQFLFPQLDVSASPWTWIIVLLDSWWMDNVSHFLIEGTMRPMTFTDRHIFILNWGIGKNGIHRKGGLYQCFLIFHHCRTDGKDNEPGTRERMWHW